ncbi:MAG: hypothetical protein QOG53_1103 [Frankiales bacterium]|jgi:hypothetical protein|nr:hypothetical protein [Frankiales bacterium]
MDEHPRPVTPDDAPRSFELWPYFDSLPESEWQGHDFSARGISYAWAMQGERWEHVLIDSEDINVKLVLVVDLETEKVLGHYLLDLNEVYGLNDDS